jgi:phenylalanyl-tRNA synthetase alpha chain
MSPIPISARERARLLALVDLTDPAHGVHALQLLVEDAVIGLRNLWSCPARVHRAAPLVTVAENYDRLGYTADAPARSSRYTRYVDAGHVLRTHTSALVPELLASLATAPPSDLLLACPGMVYRRDSIDRLHTGQPHQLDLWRIRTGRPLSSESLDAMVRRVAHTLLPGRAVRTEPADHPYTTDGLEIRVEDDGRWVEIGECGMAAPHVIERAGLDPSLTTGLAMGLGLDRIAMVRKGFADIRLLRSADPRIASQMRDLARYRPVSNQPEVARDLSVVVGLDCTAEDIGERVRSALGEQADDVEGVLIVAETPSSELPAHVRRRTRICPEQKNVLLRVIMRPLGRTLTAREANELRDRVYAAVHEGPVSEWAARSTALGS